MQKVGLFAYGEMGESVLRSLLEKFTVQWVILPSQGAQTNKEQSTEQLAIEKKIPVSYASSFIELSKYIQTHTPDLVVIASFNKILPEKILLLTKFMNVHIGDLPRYRGRATVNWAIINNRSEIGLTIHEVAPDLDAGNIYDQHMIPISHEDTCGTIYKAIDRYLAKNISQIADKVLKGYQGEAQSGEATYCCTRLPEDGLIDWDNTSKDIYNFIRAITKPYPGAFTYFEGKKMIIWDAEIPKNPKVYEGRIPGRVGAILPDFGVEVLTGDSVIIVKSISYEGKVHNASQIIKSIKKTLGINWVALYEKMNSL
jgi:methionyl-tRNA formyltransferase